MTKSKLFLTATVLLGSLAFGTVAIAGPGGGGHFMRGVRDLDLTDEQRAELRELRESSREDRGDDKAEMQSIHEAFIAELAKASPNVATLHELTDRRSELQAAHAHEKVDSLVAVHAILTPEQRAELLENMAERRAERRGERGEGRPGRGGR